MYADLVGGTATKRSDERDGGKITRTLRDNTKITGWHSIWESPFATCKNMTPRSKTAQGTSSCRHSIWESPLAANEAKTSNLERTTTKTECMQELTSRSRSQDNQLAEMMARLDAKNAKTAELVVKFRALNGGSSSSDSGGKIEANQ